MSKEIKLGRRKRGLPPLIAIVDDDDFDTLVVFRWHWSGSKSKGSVRRDLRVSGSTDSTISMANQIMGDPGHGRIWDHKNRNRLDNQKSNLRLATYSQNAMNRTGRAASGFKGVYRNGSRWAAQIQISKKRLTIGRFDSPEEAALAYDRKARVLFGDYAVTNFK